MILSACQSDPGRRHHVNQDRAYTDPVRGVYFVTDGMANDIAPQAVVDLLPPQLAAILTGETGPPWEALPEKLQAAFASVNQQIYEIMAEAGELGLGATLVLALVAPERALIAHIGDSRCYLCRGDRLEPVTRDHSLVQRMVDMGSITAEEARRTRGNGGPTRFLGQSGEVKADFRTLDLQPGDRLLLCSDGLTEMLADEDIASLLHKQPSPEEACGRLVDAANAAGGHDNVTVLIIALG